MRGAWHMLVEGGQCAVSHVSTFQCSGPAIVSPLQERPCLIISYMSLITCRQHFCKCCHVSHPKPVCFKQHPLPQAHERGSDACALLAVGGGPRQHPATLATLAGAAQTCGGQQGSVPHAGVHAHTSMGVRMRWVCMGV